MRPLVLALAALLFTGCVQRSLVIASNPPGAEVYIDGQYAGLTPLRFPFDTYGTHDVLVRHPGLTGPDGTASSFQSSLQKMWLQPPWYATFPLDFFVDHFCPVPLHDEHRLEVALEPLSERTPEEIAAARARSEAFRQKAIDLRATDPEGHTNPPPPPDGVSTGSP